MTDDDFIRELQQTWQSQNHGATQVLQRLRRKRWEPHIRLAATLVGCGIAVLCAAWFAWIAIQPGPWRLLFALSAGVLLLSVPAGTVSTVWALRSSLAWDEEPQELLRIGIRRTEGALRFFSVQRWSAPVIAAFVALLWLCQAAGLLHAPGFLVFYTLFSGVVCAGAWLYLMWQEPRIRAERAACIRLLALMDAKDTGGRGPAA
jgi:MFS family permease